MVRYLKYVASCGALLASVALLACDRRTPLEPSCTIAFDPPSLTFTSAGGSGIVNVATSATQCTWTAVASVPWISIVSGASGTGSGPIKYAVTANEAPEGRSATISIEGQAHHVTQDGQGACAYDVAPTSAAFESAGGQGTLIVSTTTSCSWTATSSESWLTITNGASGRGRGTVTYTVAAYTGPTTRTGVINVGGREVQVTQSAPGCSFTVSPQTAAFGSDAAQGTVSVSAPSGCNWTASTNNSWLTIVQGSNGQGNGSVTYQVDRQTTADVRVGTIRVAGVDVRIVQSGDVTMCQYSVAPVTFTPCMPSATLTTTITTGASCPWTSSTNVAWLMISVGESGTGPGTITVSTSDNYDAPRTGVVMVRWPTPTAGQNVQVAQAGCTYAVSKTAIAAPVAGGSFSFDVLQASDPYTCGGPLQDACVWTATADVAWITITSPVGQTKGDNPVRFTVAPNITGSARTGAIRVKDKIVTITQAGS